MASTTEGIVLNIDAPGDIAKLVKLAKSSDAARDVVKKIVIGPSPKSDGDGWDEKSLRKNEESLLALSEVDWATFPDLTHLYLWSLPHLTAVKGLPDRLKCLDVRGCTGLVRLPKLPASLETLVTDGCTALSAIGMVTGSLRHLEDVSMAQCGKLPAATANNLISSSPSLRKIDFSGSPIESQLAPWPEDIEVAIFNDGQSLEHLPAGPWPPRLRRLELRGTSITRLEPLSATLDYVNLSNLRRGLGSARLWPDDATQARPRTLMLYRSGLLVPPTFAQGADHEDNVAATVRGYFNDVALVGDGTSRRCKVLFLGNGGAGKTTLSLAIAGENPKHSLGTTHAIRFGSVERSDLKWHLWDFGGQAIYHNAHRLFMSSGAVFLVLWNPRPRATSAADNAYTDTPRPLPYWIEMIRMGCPGARIAVVCNVERTAEEKAAIGADGGLANDLQRRYRAEYDESLAGIADRPELLLCDAEDVAMVQAHVIPWLDQTIGDVVRVQGATVPAHWEIAEEMVGSWLHEAEKAQAEGRPDPRPTITVAEFRDQLVGAIDRKLASDGSDRWKKLARNWNQGAMLTADRVERVLGFLTDSGLVFWNQEHLEDVVIVGQQWALEGVYAMLERRTDTEERRTVYQLMTDDPTFTAKSIGELLWNRKGYSSEQQKILLRFMEQMKLCFRLRNDEDAWSGEGRFVSVQHLRPDEHARLARNFSMEYESSAATVSEAIEIPSLHQTRWEHALAWLGKTYGGDARYACDAFLLDRNDDGQTVLVTCAIDASGIGGRIKVWVAGHTADRQKNEETCAELLKRVGKECNAESTERERRENRGGDLPAGPTDKVSQVFISYSWNPPSHEESFFDSADRFPLDYEQPVIELCKALKDRLGPSALIWDRDYIGLATRISDFVDRAKAGSLFVVCHSGRYWRRAYCMYELLKAYEECGRREDLSFESHFAFVGFRDCECLDDSDTRKGHVDAWKARTPKVPIAIEDALKMTKDELIEKVAVLVGYNLGLMTDVVGSGTPADKKLNRFGARFGASRTSAIADWICERLARNVAGRESRARPRS